MRVVTAPENLLLRCKKSLFLAGGITNCPNWQQDFIDMLPDDLDIVLYNPRRDNFPIDDSNAAQEQIKWEFERLQDSDMIMFWFSSGSLNPIALYELGMWGNSRSDKIIFVGCDPAYERKNDVIIQTQLVRNIRICSNLHDLKEQILYHLECERLFNEKNN